MASDIFFITYDEPAAEEAWLRLKGAAPHAQRVHGIKGFDAAYKECARRASTERFFTVDGDNRLEADLGALELEPHLLASDYVLSWSARNEINGLCYGNGGVKNWPRRMAENMQTHESADGAAAAVDFCFRLPYFQMPATISAAEINGTAYQAFRAGFREGVKMCLERGQRPPRNALGKIDLGAHLWPENRNRLRIWCSVGADVPHGKWAMLGARAGCLQLCLMDWNYELIRDYDWFGAYWRENFSRVDLDVELARLERILNAELLLGITSLRAEDSAFFKSVYHNPPRQGLMFK